jgi:FtsP/CotA-like multicopper oxidase with cupredoxin domain
MRKRAHTRIPLVLALCTAAALVVGVTTASSADVTINLCATTGTVDLPGSPGVPVWGFVQKGSAADCSDVRGTATLPAPVLRVQQGDNVTVNVTNDLPAGQTLSFEVPGLSFSPGDSDAAVGSTVTRMFTASAPGTYLYQSVGDGERQTAMGLYGALIVDSTTSGQAYGTAASAFDVEAPLVLSAIDPTFNADPDAFDMRRYQPTYWLINGKAYPDTSVIHTGDDANQRRVLVRYVNAGHDNTTMTLLGLGEHVIARDAHVLPNPFDANAETIPAGETEDVIVTVPAGSAPSGLTHGFPLYNRQLHVGNGAPSASPGGMMTFIQSP